MHSETNAARRVAFGAVALGLFALALATSAFAADEDEATPANADDDTEHPAEEPDEPAAGEEETTEGSLVDRRLDNGLRVLVLPVPDRQHVAVAVHYRVGSSDVPEGYTSLAHLAEHMMFTDTIGGGSVLERLDHAGVVEVNGVTSPDRTTYYEAVPPAALPWTLWMEAERMAYTAARVDEANFERQRRIVLREHREREGHGSIGRFGALLLEHTFPEGHPYRSIYEHEDDINAIRLDHVRWFLQRWYSPANATLAIVGSVEPDEVVALVERHFGPIRGAAPPERERPYVARMAGQRVITFEMGVQRDELHLSWPTPAYFAPGDAEMDLIASYLLRDNDAPLRRALLDTGIASSVEASQRSRRLGSTFEIVARAARGHHSGELIEAIDRELAQVQRDGLELGRGANALLVRAMLRRSQAPDAEESFVGRSLGRETDAGGVLMRWRGTPASLRGAVADVALAVRHPVLDEADLERLRAQLDESHRATRGTVSAQRERALRERLYDSRDRRSRDPSGGLGTIRRATVETLRAEHARRFVPGQSQLVVTGPVSAAEVREACERSFGDWEGAGSPARFARVRHRDEGPRAWAMQRPLVPRRDA